MDGIRKCAALGKRGARKIMGKCTSAARRAAGRIKGKAHSLYVEDSIRKGRGRKLTLSVKDLFYIHMWGQEFTRMDMVVRYLAAKEYYEGAEGGSESRGSGMYCKMQDARVAQGYAKDSVKRFHALMDSYQKNGYDSGSGIITDRNLSLRDGSHRFALNIYHGESSIRALVLRVEEKAKDYSIDWFYQNGFTNDEIDLILSAAEEIKAKMTIAFTGVIWSPAQHLRDGILSDLGRFGKVTDVRSYTYTVAQYENIVRKIYEIDDIAEWKVAAKLEHMKESPPQITTFCITFDDPAFRIKATSNMPISKTVERVKANIRMRYKGRVEDYFFDTILHIADNDLQSNYMKHIFEPGIDFEEVLNVLDDYHYALMKVDVPYMPEDFPKSIPVGKDIDILCAREDLGKLKLELAEYVQKYKEYEIVKVDNPDRLLLRLQLSGKLVFQIDCCCSYEGIPEEFLNYALRSRVRRESGYYVLDPAAEAVIRRVAYEGNTDKAYHLDYYEAHRSEDMEMLFKDTGGVLPH